MTPPAPLSADRRRTAVVLVGLQLFFVGAVLPLWVLLGLAKMSGGSALRQGVLDVLVAGYPIAVLVGIVASWRAWRHDRLRTAIAWCLPPALWALVIAAAAAL